MNEKEEMIKMLKSFNGEHSAHTVFYDFVKAAALSTRSSTLIFSPELAEVDEEFRAVLKKYSPDDAEKMTKLLAMLSMALETEESDVLGEVYMESGAGSKTTGQFFTPFHVSEACARLSLDIEKIKETTGFIEMNEPACGSGGMIIAACKVLRQEGVNYQQRLKVICQDLDWMCVYMCYLQLSLLGIRGAVVQGNTLAGPYIPGKTDPKHVLWLPGTFLP